MSYVLGIRDARACYALLYISYMCVSCALFFLHFHFVPWCSLFGARHAFSFFPNLRRLFTISRVLVSRVLVFHPCILSLRISTYVNLYAPPGTTVLSHPQYFLGLVIKFILVGTEPNLQLLDFLRITVPGSKIDGHRIVHIFQIVRCSCLFSVSFFYPAYSYLSSPLTSFDSYPNSLFCFNASFIPFLFLLSSFDCSGNSCHSLATSFPSTLGRRYCFVLSLAPIGLLPFELSSWLACVRG
jgi:hypothetical protein